MEFDANPWGPTFSRENTPLKQPGQTYLAPTISICFVTETFVLDLAVGRLSISTHDRHSFWETLEILNWFVDFG